MPVLEHLDKAGIIGTEPLHWRGDREDLAAFRGAFVGLLGDDAEPTDTELQAFEDFLAQVRFPPNPFRGLDGQVSNAPLANGGTPALGEQLFRSARLDAGAFTCNDCHVLPTGTDGTINGSIAIQASQSFKVAQLGNLYEKTGFSKGSRENNRGFGFVHDGAEDTLFNFLRRSIFLFPFGAEGDQQRRHIEAFLFSLGTDTHSAVGFQVTAPAALGGDSELLAAFQNMIALADSRAVGLVAQGNIGGEARGAFYDPEADRFQTDRVGETIEPAALLALGQEGSELTFTVVPFGSQGRIGADRDGDGKLDGDERDAGADPADPNR